MKFTLKTLLNKGYSQRAIAKKLKISRTTVKNFVKEINDEGVQTPKINKLKKIDP